MVIEERERERREREKKKTKHERMHIWFEGKIKFKTQLIRLVRSRRRILVVV